MEPSPLRFFRNLNRTREITAVLLRFGFGDVLERLRFRQYLRWGKSLFVKDLPAEPESTTGRRVRMALESLGATFIKFGQVLSTRPDLVPPDIIAELSHLQEGVPPFSSELALLLLRRELKRPLEEVFAEFEEEPLAAGSLAQVHVARLHSGQRVAVKIRRPKVVQEVERDLSLLGELAILAEKYIPEWQFFDPVGMVQHFARVVRRELNFTLEGRTVEEFARLFEHDATLYVPKIYWELSTEAVLTMEFIEGYKVNGLDTLRAAGIPPEQVAANGARIFMKQAFELGIFHGDPHPGNLRVMRDGALCLLDFGMVGHLDDHNRERLVDLLLAINRNDVPGTVRLILELGQRVGPVDLPLLQADIQDFVARYYGQPLERLKVGDLLSDFINVLTAHRIRVPANLMLLLRSLVTLEGVGRELDPQFNLANHLAPFIERLVRSRYNVGNVLHRAIAEARHFLQLAHDLPDNINRSLEKLSRDQLKVQLEHKGLDDLMQKVDHSSNRLVVAMVVSALILSSALLITADVKSVWLGVPFFVTSSILGLWLIYGIFRSGRL